VPLHHPLRVAEEVATVDQISEGRFDFGVGRSGSVQAYETYGVPYAESQARFREALAIIREAWKGERFSFEGRFYRFENAVVSPRPHQAPHPPIRMAATSEETFRTVAELGLDMFVGLRGTDIAGLGAQVRAYRKAWRDAGRAGEGSVHLRLPVYAAPTEHAAVDEPRESLVAFLTRQADLARNAASRLGAGAGPGAAERRAQAEALASLTYERALATRVAFGTGPRLVDRLTELRDVIGLDGIVAELNPGGLIPADLEMRSLHILAHQVMPAFT
jgi:alkanesulfonate monooxygenase SsuD/methylene tetrahydromethanopterin reductase-like flavin-dependent oxidoreductase (luciferase family)